MSLPANESRTRMASLRQTLIETTDIQESFESEVEDEQITGEKYAEIVDEVKPERRLVQRIEKLLRFLKILFLFLLWMLMTYLLMTTFDNKVERHMIQLPPNAELDYALSELPVNALLGLRLVGPFLARDNDSMYHEPLIFDQPKERAIVRSTTSAWQLNVKVQLLTKHEPRNISTIWSVELQDPNEIEERELIYRDHIFELKDYNVESAESLEMRLLLSTNVAVHTIIPLELFIDTKAVPEMWGIIMSLLILIGFYLILFTDKVDRILAAMIASTMVIAVLASNGSRPSMDVLMKWVEPNLLMMIFGITIIMGFFVQCGVFDWLAVFCYQVFNGHIWPPINVLCAITFLLCAVLDKMTVVLMIAPVSVRLCEVMQVNPFPVFICIICFSNVGSIWTLTAAEENALITSDVFLRTNGVTQAEFVLHMLPGTILVAIQTYLQLRLNFRDIRNMQFRESPVVMKIQRLIKTLKRTADTMGTFSKDEKTVKKSLLSQIRRMRVKLRRLAKVDKPRDDYASTLASLKALYPLREKLLLIKCCIVLALAMVLFLLSTMTELQKLSLGWIALMGALLLLILSDVENMEAVLLRVEWGTCLFLACFFVLMQGVVRLGVTQAIGQWTIDAVLYFEPENRFAASIILLLWISGVSSIFLYSVPMANTMVHVSIVLATNAEAPLPLHPMVWALTFGTCIGNNGLLISGFSNVICAGIAEHHGYKFRFKHFFKICLPITLGGLIVATIYLVLCHIVGSWQN